MGLCTYIRSMTIKCGHRSHPCPLLYLYLYTYIYTHTRISLSVTIADFVKLPFAKNLTTVGLPPSTTGSLDDFAIGFEIVESFTVVEAENLEGTDHVT